MTSEEPNPAETGAAKTGSCPVSGRQVVATTEGSVSGYLEAGVGADGEPMVRQAGTQQWFLCAREHSPDRTFSEPEEVAAAIESAERDRDAAGNTRPFRF